MLGSWFRYNVSWLDFPSQTHVRIDYFLFSARKHKHIEFQRRIICFNHVCFVSRCSHSVDRAHREAPQSSDESFGIVSSRVH